MDLTQLYSNVDDFSKDWKAPKLLHSKRKYTPRKQKLSPSEVATIAILFHQSNFRNFKLFYLNYVCKYLTKHFPDLVSYSRMVVLIQENMLLLASYLKSRMGKCTGISFIDSTPIQVCKPKRISRNKVFKNIARIGKSTIGWFYGFKLHLVINEVGELLSVVVTKGNRADTSCVLDLTKNLFGKLFADKGYISKKLTEKLFDNNINLITGIRKNMKDKMLNFMDKILLRKRSVIETVNDQLKNISQVEHSRHRSVLGFISNMLSGLIAYTHQDKKPSIRGVNYENLVKL